jgi:hypothetical protein
MKQGADLIPKDGFQKPEASVFHIRARTVLEPFAGNSNATLLHHVHAGNFYFSHGAMLQRTALASGHSEEDGRSWAQARQADHQGGPTSGTQLLIPPPYQYPPHQATSDIAKWRAKCLP